MPYKNKELNTKWQKLRRRNTINRLREYRISIGKCSWCGYSEHPEILQFHHREPNTKKFSFSLGGVGNYSWSTILSEIDKCDLICPNCHFWYHYPK